MFASAGFSFVLYLLVFFRLRGNITLSDGYKVHFQKRPKVRVGRTAAGTYIMTDDRRVESHLTTVAKQMLWCPIAYTVLVLPIAAARFSTFAGASVPFPVTIFTAAVFMLTGFVNALLFCVTRNVLPGTWKQRFGIGSTLDTRRGNIGVSSRTNATWRSVASNARVGTIGAGTAPIVLNVDVEKNIEIKYEDADIDEMGPSFLKFGSPALPTPPFQDHGDVGQRTDDRSRRPGRLSFQEPRDARKREGDGGNYPSAGVHSAGRANTAAPASFHPFATATPVNTDTRSTRPPSILIIEPAANHPGSAWAANGDSGVNGSGTHWTGSNR